MEAVTKESLIKEVARLYKNMTVVEFARKFGKLTTALLARAVRLAKVIGIQCGELV